MNKPSYLHKGILAAIFFGLCAFSINPSQAANPNPPTLISPVDGHDVISQTPELYAKYTDADASDTGTVHFRVSSGSGGDCIGNLNIVDSGTSLETATENEPARYLVSTSLTEGSTYTWCAQSDDGIGTSVFTSMGSFTVDTRQPPAPSLVYSTFLGNGGGTQGFTDDLATDSYGNVYLIARSTSFPVTSGAYDETFNGGAEDLVVAKINYDGSALIYATYIGGSDRDVAQTVEVNASGEATIAGFTFSSGYPTTVGSYDQIFDGGPGEGDGFITRLNASGSQLIFSTFLGGSDWDTINDFYIDGSGDIYVTGDSNSADLPATTGSLNAGFDVFVAKLNSTASSLTYLIYVGSAGNDNAEAIEADGSGNAYIIATVDTGYPTVSAYDSTYNGGTSDLAVTKINATGDTILYSTYLGSTGVDRSFGQDKILDSNDKVIVVGSTNAADFPSAGAVFDSTHNGVEDIIVVRLNTTVSGGSSLEYATFIGSDGYEEPYLGTIDSSNNVYVVGETCDADTPITEDAVKSIGDEANCDGYIAKLSADASTLLHGSFVGGDDNWEAAGVVVLDPTENYAYFSFQTFSSDYPVTGTPPTILDDTRTNADEIYLTKYGFSGRPNEPTLLAPPDGGEVASTTPVLYARYDDLQFGDTGTVNFRVASSSAADCLSGTNIVSSGASTATNTNNEPASFTVSPALIEGATYYWCAENDDGVLQSGNSYTTMGSFTVESAPVPLGVIYSTFIGGISGDEEFASGITADSEGNAYVFAYTEAMDFPVTSGAFDESFTGTTVDCFLAKLNPEGTALIYGTYLGGTETSTDCGDTTISVDSLGSVYIGGSTSAPDFPTTPGAFDTTHNGGGTDTFALKIDPTGSSLVYSTFIGGSADDRTHYSRLLQSTGELYMAGHTSSADFPTTTGPALSATDIHVTKISADGSSLIYSRLIGGTGIDLISNLAVNTAGEAFVGGRVTSTDFPVIGASALSGTYGGGAEDGVLFKLNAAGTTVDFSGYIGGSGRDRAWGVDVDASGNIFVMLSTESTDVAPAPTGGVFQGAHGGGTEDVYLLKVDSTASTLLFATYFGGSGDDGGYRMKVDNGGNPVLSAWTDSADFPITDNATKPIGDTINGDIYITKMNSTGTALIHSTYFGGDADWEGIYELHIDANDDLYITGQTYSSDYPTTPGAFRTVFDGGVDVNVTKYSFLEIPYAPTLVSPPDASTVSTTTPELYAFYHHPTLAGIVNVRVSSGSLADCLNNINIISNGSSSTTATRKEPAGFTASGLSNGTSYNWCAQNDDSTDQSPWTSMGSFMVDSSTPSHGILYATILGGSVLNRPQLSTLDEAGNIYMTGYTNSGDFPTTSGAFSNSYAGSSDAYVMKLNTTGDVLLFSTLIGGTAFDSSIGIQVDPSANVYIAGRTDSTGFPTTVGAFEETSSGSGDTFVSKLDPSGSTLIYSTILLDSYPQEMDIDDSGNAYIGGFGAGTSFPTTAGVIEPGPLTNSPWVTKINPTGTGLVFSTYLYQKNGVITQDGVLGVAVDTSGNVYTSGFTDSTTVPTTAGAFDETFNGGTQDIYVVKLNSNATSVIYGTYIGGPGDDGTWGIGLDEQGQVHLSGWGSAGFPTTVGAHDTSHNGGLDIVVLELNSTGTALNASTFVGGSGDEWTDGSMALDDSGVVYVSGATCSADFPVTDDALDNVVDDANCDAVVLRLSPLLNTLHYASALGGTDGFETGYRIHVDDNELAYIYGETESTNFPLTDDLSIAGASKYAFAVKYAFPPLPASGGRRRQPTFEAPAIASALETQEASLGEKSDLDIDGDGILNQSDDDIDGDGIENSKDEDIDGDGIPNRQDNDMDGDLRINANDADVDGDFLLNQKDDDIDQDGVENILDEDDDGDGITDEEDETPQGINQEQQNMLDGESGLSSRIESFLSSQQSSRRGGVEGEGEGEAHSSADGEKIQEAIDLLAALRLLFDNLMLHQTYTPLKKTLRIQASVNKKFHSKLIFVSISERLGFTQGIEYRLPEREILDATELMKTFVVAFSKCYEEKDLERMFRHDVLGNEYWFAGYYFFMDEFMQLYLGQHYEFWSVINEIYMLGAIETYFNFFCPARLL